jgi:hypothetical protein
MADAQAAPANAGQAQANQQGGFSQIISVATRVIMFYMIFNWLFGSRSVPVQKDSTGQVLPPHVCMFPRGQVCIITICVKKLAI